MSVSAIASLRPLHGQCLRQARTGLLSVQIKSRSASLNIRATVALRPQQRRWRSDLEDGGDGDAAKGSARRQPSQQQKKLTFRQFTGRAITVSIRNLAYLMSPQGFRQAYRSSPIATALMVALYAHSPSLFCQKDCLLTCVQGRHHFHLHGRPAPPLL